MILYINYYMKSYIPIQPKKFQQKIHSKQNKEGKRFKNFILQKEYNYTSNPISTEFAMYNNHTVLYTTSGNMYYFNLLNDKISTNFPQCPTGITSSCIRNDGKIICVGSDQGLVKIYEPDKKLTLASYNNAFKTKINCISFNNNNYNNVENNKFIACSQDLSLKYFSLDCLDPLVSFDKCFTDYINTANFVTENLILAGSMDNKLRLFDIRSGKMENSLTVSNNSPIYDIKIDYICNNKIYISSNNQLSSVDLNMFQETNFNCPITSSIKKIVITENRIFCVSAAGEKFVSVNEKDSLKKLYVVKLNSKEDIIDFDITHSMNKFTFVDIKGRLEIKQKNLDINNNKNKSADNLDEINYDFLNPENYSTKHITRNYSYLNRGQYIKDNKYLSSNDKITVVNPEKSYKTKLLPHDLYLKKFMFKEALDEVIKFSNPEYVISVLESLISCNALYISMLNRKYSEIIPILEFIHWKIDDYRYQPILIILYNLTIDYYYPTSGEIISNSNAEENKFSKEAHKIFKKIYNKINNELKLQKRISILNEKIKTAISLNNLEEY